MIAPEDPYKITKKDLMNSKYFDTMITMLSDVNGMVSYFDAKL
jgi:hypothetical protein